MAKKIFMTETDVESVVSELRASLTGMKCYGAIDIKRSFKADDRFAMIYFTATAWAKMTTLVARYSTEVQWHGKVRRLSENEFEVFDIIVPPHEVTGTTVTSEYRPYGEWLNGLDDETFEAVKFHGHSHVDMSVSPSGTDEKYRLDLVTQLPKPINGMDVFYIFLIINKRHEWSAEIYDLSNNALYSTDDIEVDALLGEYGEESLETYIAAAKRIAVSRYAYSGTHDGAYSSSCRASGSYSSYQSQPKVVTPVSQVGTTKSATAYTSSKLDKDKKNGEGKGKCCGYDSWAEYYDAVYGPDESVEKEGVGFEDENDPKSPFYVRDWGCT